MISLLFRFLPQVIVVLGILGSLAGAWKTGYNHAVRKYEIAQLKQQLETAKKDIEIIQKAKIDEEEKSKELEELSSKLKDQVDEILKASNNSCVLSDDDVKRLRNLGK
jgi:hypothetical protein